MKVLFKALFLAGMAWCAPAHAQSVSGHANTGTLRVGNMLVNIANLSAQYNDNMARLKELQTCMAKSMFYAPSAPDADVDGCSKEIDPKIGDASDKLYPNSLCQSTDGKTVTCPTLDQSKILTVMSQAWGAGATRTATVSCPNGTLRLGCAGARGLDSNGNMTGDCDEGTCGLVGVTAIGNNGCSTTARVDGTSTDEPVVYATCLSLTGSYTPPANPTAPTPPAATCSLPWGGTLASGSSVTAYASGTASCGSSCSNISQTRTCTNGTLSGSYTSQTCKAATCGCSAQTHYWGMGCEAQAPNLTEGATAKLSERYCYGGPEMTTGATTITCVKGQLVDSADASCKVQFCFVPTTPVTMADGTTKPVKDLKVGDRVKGKTRINTVTGVPNLDVDQKIYGFNGGKPFVTGGHPFWTKHGWKAVDPALTPTEHHNVKTTALKVGDSLLLATGKWVKIKNITSAPVAARHVFNPQMDGDHTYYAGGYLVHNKMDKCE